ncbi:unnamed protein product, partial [Mesorhabditis belari]|uniref:Cation efflux protein transmembrane domain-containing protein n=1 Tax=Mesorhabditis belari TaxID=2138241 RepID=A0AAF3J2A7_9BILA
MSWCHQKELLEKYAKDDECIRNGGIVAEPKDTTKGDNLLSQLVLVSNLILLIGKSFSAYLTQGTSLSIIATLLDSVVDITSGLAVWYATHLIMNTDVLRYPLGREVLENMSIIFIGTVMGMGNAYVVYDSFIALFFGKPPPIFTTVSLAILVFTILIKAFLYFQCRRRKTKNAEVLSVDQLNDVFTNILVIFGTLMAQWVSPLCDPVVAALVSGYIAFNWFSMVVEQFDQVVGGACSPEDYGRIARVISRHPKVRAIDALLVYHAGQKVRVEAHVVTEATCPADLLHDELLEPLQKSLESLPFVDKAFVHPDYQLDGVVKYVPS